MIYIIILASLAIFLNINEDILGYYVLFKIGRNQYAYTPSFFKLKIKAWIPEKRK